MAKSDIVYPHILPKRPLAHGIASLLDFHGATEREIIERIRARHRNGAPIQNTDDSLRATWQAVGDSLRWAIGEYEKELDEIAAE